MNQRNVARLLHQLGHVEQAQCVDFQRPGKLLPKIHAGRRMDDDVRPPGKLCKILQAQPEVFFGYLARDAVHLLAAELPEPGGAFPPQPVKNRGGGNFPVKALPRRRATVVSPDQQNDFIDIRNFPNDFLNDHFPQKPGRAGDQDSFAGQLALHGYLIADIIPDEHQQPPGR